MIYTDKGVSAGMRIAIDDALAAGRVIEYRQLAVYSPRVLSAVAARHRWKAEVEARLQAEANVTINPAITVQRGAFMQRRSP